MNDLNEKRRMMNILGGSSRLSESAAPSDFISTALKPEDAISEMQSWLIDHIRRYIGENRGQPCPYPEAVNPLTIIFQCEAVRYALGGLLEGGVLVETPLDPQDEGGPAGLSLPEFVEATTPRSVGYLRESKSRRKGFALARDRSNAFWGKTRA